jgi:2-succinyl-5-enolpyruvyl-6-hydroxy-3-cyclohexene-1-carboxylate synthase
MIHRHQHISDLGRLCRILGVERIVISPGSRNAPLIASFFSEFGSACYSIVDERSAAYVALGMARNLQKPVVVISTSGTAVLNYSPAIAEAYYQRIPLIVITADRPEKWIDQQDNQTIRQKDVYRNFIVKSLSLRENFETEEDLRHTHSEITDLIGLAVKMQGPVHLNVPLAEPLYEPLPAPTPGLTIEPRENTQRRDVPEELILQWENAQRILIIHGQDFPNAELQESMNTLLKDPRVVVVAENLSNLAAEEILDQPELMLFRKNADDLPVPELIL